MFFRNLLKPWWCTITTFALLRICSVSSITYDCKDGNETSEEEWEAKIKEGAHPRELKGICMPPDYDRFSQGNLTEYKTIPPKINVSFTLLGFAQDRQEYQVWSKLAYEWTDARLRVVDNDQLKNVVPSTLKHVWNPDLHISYFRDGENVRTVHHLPKPTREGSLRAVRDWRVNGSDFVRFEVTFLYWFIIPSEMGYTYYPYDKHQLSFSIGFGGLEWASGNHSGYSLLSKNVKHSWFYVAVSSSKEENHEDNISAEYHGWLFVVLCWLSMFIPVELAAERVTLCTGTLLTITMFYNTASQVGPTVTYLRAMDIWLLGCISFIFVILFENIAVMKMAGRHTKMQRDTRHNSDDKIGKTFENISQMQLGILGVGESGRVAGRETEDGVSPPQSLNLSPDDLKTGDHQIDNSNPKFAAARRVDRASIFVITAGILIFNVVYWSWLLASNQIG